MKPGKFIQFTIIFLSAVSFTGRTMIIDTTRNNSLAVKPPSELVGKWLNGTFSMSNWWGYDGKKYIGNPYSRSVAFHFTATGEAEFFLAIKTHSGYCSTEGFSYQKGNVKFNDKAHSFTVYPEKGNYRGFYSCAAGSNFDRPAKNEELKPTTYYWSLEKDESGQQWLVIRFSPDPSSAGSYFKATSW
ncbi:MAG: hypothetical protein ACXWWC_11230 [Chitinophagaceae bacterium]